jgi:hypothetical protein
MSGTRAAKAALAGTAAGLVLLVAAAAGQTRTNEIAIHFGVISSDQVIDILEDPAAVVLPAGAYAKAGQTFSAVPFLTYRRWVSRGLAFGATAGYFSSSGALVPEGGEVIAGEFRERNYVGAVEVEVRWLTRRALTLYSGAGFGVKVRRGRYADGEVTEAFTKALPTFHLSAIGLRAGGRVGFFAEAGYGYKGVLAAGLDARF